MQALGVERSRDKELHAIGLLKWLFVGFPLFAASTMLFYRAMSPETSDTVPGLYQHASI